MRISHTSEFTTAVCWSDVGNHPSLIVGDDGGVSPGLVDVPNYSSHVAGGVYVL